MKPISAAQPPNVLSLHSNGYSTRKISEKLVIGKSTVAEIVLEYDADKENFKGGHPRKLTSTDRHVVRTVVRTGKTTTAVEAAKCINSVVPQPVTVQTVRNVLKEDGYKAYVRNKCPSLKPQQWKSSWPLL